MNYDIFNNSVPRVDFFNHRHKSASHIDLVYIIGGNAVFTVNRQKYAVGEGDVMCIPKGHERSVSSRDPARYECYHVNFHLFAQNGEEIDVPLPVHSQVGIHNDLIAHFRRLNEDFLTRSDGFQMRARARLMLILQRFMEILVFDADTHQFDPRVKTAIRYIEENFAEHLTISNVAAAVSLNPVYFGVLFKRETGVTFRDYLNTVRISQAEAMLGTGKWNVTEVASLCGFSDVFYFSRLFKKHKGVPPSSIQ